MDKDDIIEEYEKKHKRLRLKFIIITIFIAVIVAVFSSEFTVYYYLSQGLPLKADAKVNPNENIDSIAKSLKNFRTVIDQVFLGEIDEDKILDETIKGYVNGLDDEYSEYMTAEEWSDFQTAALGNYVGVGIYMSMDKNDNIIVLSPIKESPAEAAGIKPGDIITAVDDESVIGMTSSDVSMKIKGEAGTKVKVTIYRDGEYIDFEMERSDIKIYHVEKEMLENNIGYISLYTFDEGCSSEFLDAYMALKSQGAKKIIIDLRDNTGGLVEEALTIIDMFVPKDTTLLVTVDADGNKELSKAQTDQIITEETVILTNEYSASASEIMVGALQDSDRAITVGEKTFGKGVIQSVFMLNDGSALKLTVNEYFTPKETKINKVGIAPDYEVEYDKETESDEQLDKAIELLK